jgi:hypothetical protein
MVTMVTVAANCTSARGHSVASAPRLRRRLLALAGRARLRTGLARGLHLLLILVCCVTLLRFVFVLWRLVTHESPPLRIVSTSIGSSLAQVHAERVNRPSRDRQLRQLRQLRQPHRSAGANIERKPTRADWLERTTCSCAKRSSAGPKVKQAEASRVSSSVSVSLSGQMSRYSRSSGSAWDANSIHRSGKPWVRQT